MSLGKFKVADAHIAAAREHRQRARADDLRADAVAPEMETSQRTDPSAVDV